MCSLKKHSAASSFLEEYKLANACENGEKYVKVAL